MTAGLRWSKMFPSDMANFQYCAGYVNDLGLDPTYHWGYEYPSDQGYLPATTRFPKCFAVAGSGYT